jgi:hypothetical protein
MEQGNGSGPSARRKSLQIQRFEDSVRARGGASTSIFRDFDDCSC